MNWMNKNDIFLMTIEDISNDGEGIGHADGGMAVFVKDALVGDLVKVKIIKVKKSYAYGRLMELVKPSPYRVDAPCVNAARCGGCSIMHMSYEKQKEYKWNKVKDCFVRIGGIVDIENKMEPIIGMDEPFCYRNKMQFPVGVDKYGKVLMGFYAGRTHSIIDMDRCVIGHPVNNVLIRHMKEWLQSRVDADSSYIYDETTHKGLIRHVLTRVGFATGELMVCVVINGESLANHHGKKAMPLEIINKSLIQILESAVREYNESVGHMADGAAWFDAVRANAGKAEVTLKSVSLNINREKTNRILGDKCITIWGSDYITDYIGDVRFHISPMSFFQVNPMQTKVLYDKAVEYAALEADDVVWDLYCGIGTISLSLARYARKVYGVEVVPQAIEDAKENAHINNIANVEFFCGRAEEIVPAYLKDECKTGERTAVADDSVRDGRHPDVVVLDPPRKGCDASLIDTIADMMPKRLVYVSCDPATLARDVKILAGKGYEVQKVAVVDQFCHSVHVETVVKLSLKKDTPKIEVTMELDEESNYLGSLFSGK